MGHHVSMRLLTSASLLDLLIRTDGRNEVNRGARADSTAYVSVLNRDHPTLETKYGTADTNNASRLGSSR